MHRTQRGSSNTTRTDLQGKDLGYKNPGNGPHAGRETGNVDDEAHGRDESEREPRGRHMKGNCQQKKRCGHPSDAHVEKWFATDAVDKEKCDDFLRACL